MTFGYVDSHYIDWAAGQTESRLRNGANRLGISFLEFINRVDGAMAAVNGNNDPLVSALTVRTTNDRIEGGYTAAKVFQRSAEYTIPRPQRGSGGGWLLPLYENAITLGFTKKALEVMSIPTFEGELATTVQAIVRGQRADVLERLFLDTEFGLDNDGTGSSPGFAGSGTGTNVYSGANPPGVSSLNLYARVTTGANAAAQVATFQTYLNYFHGPGALELLTSSAGITEVTAMAGFIEAGSAFVRPAAGTAEAIVDPGQYIGVLNGNILVRHADPQITGNVLAIYKSYGANSVQNPLAWRYSDIWGPDAWVEDRELYPLANAVVNQNFGIGVNNRAGAALIAVAGSGTYAANAPVISR
jgi:hypothetical protein